MDLGCQVGEPSAAKARGQTTWSRARRPSRRPGNPPWAPAAVDAPADRARHRSQNVIGTPLATARRPAVRRGDRGGSADHLWHARTGVLGAAVLPDRWCTCRSPGRGSCVVSGLGSVQRPSGKPGEAQTAPGGLPRRLLRSEEFESFVDELCVELEDAAVPGIGVDHQLTVGEAAGQVG
jgi:hypothetical protein